jgi:hypoxanthine-DNA glycosylase
VADRIGCQIDQKINKFWELVGAVIDVDLRTMDYASRLSTLLSHGIGLWDVIAEARRQGSLDSQIRAHDENDLIALCAGLPQLQTIAFNGATAGKIGTKILGRQAERYRVLRLPSSSPAYTLAYADKLVQWQMLRSK